MRQQIQRINIPTDAIAISAKYDIHVKTVSKQELVGGCDIPEITSNDIVTNETVRQRRRRFKEHRKAN